jgi:hypothetical protein
VRSIGVTQYGVTFGQSIGDAFVVGSTVKLVRAGVARAVTTAPLTLDAADDLDVPRNTALDFDLGVLARLGHVRLGAAVKNVTNPTFGDPGTLTLPRQFRVGAAWFSQKTGGFRGVVLTGDADLTTTSTVLGDVRHIAGGVETWMANGRVGLRGGLSGNTIGAARPAGSAGFSLGITKSVHINAAGTWGRDSSLSGWGAGVSTTF